MLRKMWGGLVGVMITALQMSKEPLQSRKKKKNSAFSLVTNKCVFRCSERLIFLRSLAFYNSLASPNFSASTENTVRVAKSRSKGQKKSLKAPDTTIVYNPVTPALSLCRARMAVNSFCTVNLSSPRRRSFSEYWSTTSGCPSSKVSHRHKGHAE